MSKELQIRNSTVDFLVFTRDVGEDGIEVRVQNGDVWLTQKAIDVYKRQLITQKGQSLNI